MINKVILLGNLGAEPEVRHLESGSTVAKFRMATNRNYKDKNGEWQQVTQWHNVVAWRQLAERVERDLHKGSTVYVEGELTHRKYQDKDGNDRIMTEVSAYVIKSLDRRDQDSRNDYSDAYSAGTSTGVQDGSNTTEGMEEMEDDLPF